MNAGAVGTQSLAERALSEGFGRLRYRDTSLLIWQQQQQQLERRVLGPGPDSYLGRSQSMWYQRFGNQPVLVRDRAGLRGAEDPDTDPGPDTGRSRVCALM